MRPGRNLVAQNSPQNVERFDQAAIGKFISNTHTMAGRTHQSVIPQDFEMTRRGRLGDAKLVRQLGDIVRLFVKRVQDENPYGIHKGVT